MDGTGDTSSSSSVGKAKGTSSLHQWVGHGGGWGRGHVFLSGWVDRTHGSGIFSIKTEVLKYSIFIF